jgi:hypothetical protein
MASKKKTPSAPPDSPEPLPGPCPDESRAFLSVDRAAAKRIEKGVVPTFVVDMPAFQSSKHLAAVVVRTDKGICAFHVSVGNYTIRNERRALVQIEDCHKYLDGVAGHTYANPKAKKPQDAVAWAVRELVKVDAPPAPSPVKVRQADTGASDARNEHAMSQIAKLLDGREWDASTLDEVAEIVRDAGWTVGEPRDDE